MISNSSVLINDSSVLMNQFSRPGLAAARHSGARAVYGFELVASAVANAAQNARANGTPAPAPPRSVSQVSN